jgi:hypothetical protein
MPKNLKWKMVFGLAKTAAVVLLAVWSSSLHAEADAQPSVEGLNHFSDVIVVGTGTITNTDGIHPIIRIVPVRIIKGKGITINKAFEVVINTISAGCGAPAVSTESETAIWFLKTSSDGTLRFSISPKSQSCHPLESDYETSSEPLPPKWTYSDSLDPRDKLAYELAFSIDNHQGNGPFCLILNSQLLQGVGKESGKDIYAKLAASENTETRLVGLHGLVRQGDIPTLQYVSANLSELEHAPARKFITRNGARVAITYGNSGNSAATHGSAIAESIAGITNPDNLVVRELGKILQASSDQLIRYAAARALQDLHTALAITFLESFLNDSDPQMRAFAIGGLSCFANGVPVIDRSAKDNGLTLSGTSPYKTIETLSHFAMGVQTIGRREPFYLDYWRSWWSANGSSVNAQAHG